MFIFLYLMIFVKSSLAVSTNEGKEFVISTPSSILNHDAFNMFPRLTLTMVSADDCQVRILTHWALNPDLITNTTIDLPADKAKVFVKNYNYFGLESANGVRWVYRLIGTQPFAVLVTMMENANLLETFTALPVIGWGKKYFVVTLESFFNVVLVNHVGTTVVVMHVLTDNGQFRLKIDKQEYTRTERAVITLLEFQAYGISSCSFTESVEGSITGSYLESASIFGVVNGHCRAITYVRSCNSNDKKVYRGKTGNIMGEMLIPFVSFGKSFVTFVPLGVRNPGFYVITASGDHTRLNIFNQGREEWHTLHKGQWVSIPGQFAWLECDVACQVVYFQNSSCLQNGLPTDNGGPSMLVVIPCQLYYFIYAVMVPDVTMSHYLTLIVRQRVEVGLRQIHTMFAADNFPTRLLLDHVTTIEHSNYQGIWVVVPFSVQKNENFLVLSNISRFGCFLYGVGATATYMHNVGFISSNINLATCRNSMGTMKIGDLIDNDCDGSVDEEFSDKMDEDNDGKVDEDLRHFYRDMYAMVNEYSPHHPALIHDITFKVNIDIVTTKAPLRLSTYVPKIRTPNPMVPITITTPLPTFAKENPSNGSLEQLGDYGEWSKWRCTEKCSNPMEERRRSCKLITSKSRCNTSLVETRQATCHVGKTCPGDCPDFKWDLNCASSCQNCEKPCDKFTGKCQQCKSGFQIPEKSCTISCKHNQFGKDCLGNCLEKCGQDCVERINGDCPSQSTGLLIGIIIAVIFLIVGIFSFLTVQRKRTQLAKPNENSENTAMSEMSNSKSQISNKTHESAATEKSEKSEKSDKSPAEVGTFDVSKAKSNITV
nr:multiple epidermal growth factor-like domains protein 10 [Biomphalaria glabrata]